MQVNPPPDRIVSPLRGQLLRVGVVMLLSTCASVIFLCRLEEFEPPVRGESPHALAKCLHISSGHWLKSPRHLKVLLENPDRLHSANCGCYGQAHCITQSFVGRDRSALYHLARTSETLHAERRDATLVCLWQNLSFQNSGMSRQMH